MSFRFVQIAPWLRAADALTNDVLAIDAQLAMRASASICTSDDDLGFASAASTEVVRDAVRLVHVCAHAPVPAVDRDSSLIVRFHGTSNTTGARVLLERSDLVLATGARSAEVAATLGARDLVVMPPFIPLDEFFNTRGVSRRVPETIVTVGPFRSSRRPERAVLCDHHIRTHVAPAVNVVMVGRVPDVAVAEGMARMNDELRLGHSQLGVLAHPAYVEAIAAATAVVLFADAETFGVAAVEAMAVGVPVVAVGGSTLSDTVADAAVVLGGSERVGVIAEAIAALRSDGTFRSSLVARGRLRAEELAPSRSAWILQTALSRVGFG